MKGTAHRSRQVLLFLILSFSFERTLHPQTTSAVVISQIYGGGGNSGATLRNDFIELFNRGNTPVGISDWTVQYASASGSSWVRTALVGTIQPGQYFLVQEGQGDAGSASLPTPDAVGGIALSATSAKIALVRSSFLLSGSSPTSPDIVDFARIRHTGGSAQQHDRGYSSKQRLHGFTK
jgi:predicted extracellular nuclease